MPSAATLRSHPGSAFGQSPGRWPADCRDTSPSAGLVIHRRWHPSKHARRLVLETATIDLTWHRYCLETHRIASGQKPVELQRTMREICAGPSDQLDHRLGINVAQALGPEACVRPGESTVAVRILAGRS